ncbi:heme-binding protein 2 [Hippocampus zosterae]|uniref:heme-binding protein 2 n=1 Tax=Hippocampus zosterae TaxID=109293 RepID=UPI00223E2A8D|nr:heme-binding protein 2 [Hippocampus zosterae]
MFKAVGQAFFSYGLQYPKFTGPELQPKDYEVRTYQAAKWVSTTLSGTSLDESKGVGFRRLFNYIQGNNYQKVKVEMTAPVTCRVDPGAGPACESHFTVSFFIPEEHRDAPPQPSDPDVFLENRDEFTAYVRSYGGFSNETLERDELLKLKESLRRDGVHFAERPYYVAGYDSPFKLVNRRNEVWLLKQNEQS